MITGTALTFIINLVTSVTKKYVMPKVGATGVQILVFILALIGTAYLNYGSQYPSLIAFVTEAAKYFAGAIVLYEVLLSKFDFFTA